MVRSYLYGRAPAALAAAQHAASGLAGWQIALIGVGVPVAVVVVVIVLRLARARARP